ncbi:sensor histidine kinase [Tundrisphaera lichenicola]|uniref:sensor histidine kinase n=1 Tax=Tundrisphaera lichenicola TaxID=2029860 RepID=UPI003EB751FC
MNLSTRLSLFFLGALAVVLLGFSGALYLLGHSYLTRQIDERLEKALDTLEAAVDVETDGLEWEPEDRRLTLGMDTGVEDVRWIIQDRLGGLIDQSPNIRFGEFSPPFVSKLLPERAGDATSIGDFDDWWIARRHLRLPELLKIGKGHPEDDDPGDDVEYPELVLTVGLSPAPIKSSLGRLAVALAGVSMALWLLCAAVGRRLCRSALSPMTRMAKAAREMTAADGGYRLPSPGTGDELEDLGRAFNELLGRLHATLERQRQFTGDASHQLRTPLAGLLNLVEVIRRRPRPPEEYEQALDQVHREAERLRQIVEALLFLARTESEAMAPDREPIDLTAWVPEQLGRWSDHPRAADLRVEVPDDPAWVRAHPSLLAQLLENLVENALKYSDPSTPVVVSCRSESGLTNLVIEDSGMGMTDDELASIFDPFYRSPQARRLGRGGVGLGLSVVRRIVVASGGSIEVESQPGRGTRFVIRFPGAKASEIEPSRTAAAI